MDIQILRTAGLGLSVAVLFFCPMSGAEAVMNKCTDGRQITYTNEPCEKMGLNSAGPIKDAVTVMPLVSKPKDDASGKTGKEPGDNNNAPKIDPAGDDSGADVPREITIKPVSPLVKKMLDW